MKQPPRIRPGWVVWAQMLRSRTYRLLRMQVWFPHAPLAVVVGVSGLTQLLLTSGSLRRLIAQSTGGKSIISVAGGLDMPAIRGVPQETIGALLLVVGIALLWRSRLAWLLTFLLTLATVALELSPLSTASRSLVLVNVLLLMLLLVFRRSFTRASLATSTLFALTGVLFTLGYGVLGSYVLGGGFEPRIGDFASAVYFAVVTMSTVGYGDITPRTPEARWFSISLIVLGLVVFATSLSAMAGPMVEGRLRRLLQPRRRTMKRASHIIVVGDGPLARNAVRALSARGLQTTAIWPAPRPHDPAPPEDLLIGDGSDTEVLRSAGIEEARAVLALSEDDSYNAFVILAAKEMNPSARTVLAVGNTGNTARAARVHPDVILALPLIGSELLAMALSGEEVKADALVDQLMKLA
ncbi:MAG TPA: ion channel [Steroidobacteraceae bacterium]|nr:ion channel [Steroidobacteraceae bacterium]